MQRHRLLRIYWTGAGSQDMHQTELEALPQAASRAASSPHSQSCLQSCSQLHEGLKATLQTWAVV